MGLLLKFIGCIVFAFLYPCNSHCADFDVPIATERNVNEVLALFDAGNVEGVELGTLRHALEQLIRRIDPGVVKAAEVHEGDSILAKAIIMAKDFNGDSSRIAEVEEYYITNGFWNSLKEREENGIKSPFVPKNVFAPTVKPMHAAPEYRFVWEFFMMARWVPRQLQGFPDRVANALVKIGDPRSVVVVEQRYLKSAADTRADPRWFNQILVEFPSERCLQAILSCSEEWDEKGEARRQKARDPGGIENNRTGDPSAEFLHLKQTSPMKAEAWKRVIASSSAETPSQKATLQKIRTALSDEKP